MNGRRLGGVIAAGLGVGLVALYQLQRPAEQQPASLPGSTQVPETKAPPPRPEPQAPRSVVALANPAAQPPAPADEPPPPQRAAESAPSVEPPAQAAQPQKPDSVFGWGPWAGQQQPSGSAADPPPGAGSARNSGVLPGVSVAANSASASAGPRSKR